MADKLLIILMNTDPTNPSELGTPFMQASVAAAMEYEVEILLTGRAGELANIGVAEKLRFSENSPKTVYDLIRDAVDAGAKIKVCTSNLELWDDELIPEINETVGAAYIISEAMDEDTVTFTY
ncbi:MAG: DsrE family protein [Ectothiorhodospiraceae bacterium]|nr:DsrE family protein [Ectothiorhodospiraceae bacterium]